MIKILLFEPYPFQIFGNQKYITFIFRYINKTCFKPVLVTPMEGELCLRVRDMGYDAFVLETPAMLKKYGGSILRENAFRKTLAFISILQFTFRLSRLIRREKIDLIHCNNLRGLLMTAIASKLTGTPCLRFISAPVVPPA